MEAAAEIRKKLAAERGFGPFASFEELGGGARFGAVSLFNLLDRCDDPLGLLKAAVNALRPDGVLLVSTVLPFCPIVYEGVKGKVGSAQAAGAPAPIAAELEVRTDEWQDGQGWRSLPRRGWGVPGEARVCAAPQWLRSPRRWARCRCAWPRGRACRTSRPARWRMRTTAWIMRCRCCGAGAGR